MEHKPTSRGTLRFKGGSTKHGGIKKSKSKAQGSSRTSKSSLTQATGSLANESAKDSESRADEQIQVKEFRDTRTAAQRNFDVIRQMREEQTLQKTASLTHRERIEAMNTHLSKLSEHNDMPKIGPG